MDIRAYLRNRGRTLAGFADEVGVSPAAMGRYAAGKRSPRPNVVRRIVAASGGAIEPNDLFLPQPPAAESSPPSGSETGYEAIDLLLSDLNGTIRGKRIEPGGLDKALANELRMPGSVFCTDITGESVSGTGLLWAVGDADKTLAPVDGRVRPVPWAEYPLGQLLMTMVDDDGSPFNADPRAVLSGVVERFAETGLRPVVAVELEFYLLDRERGEEGAIQPPVSPATGLRERTTQVYGMQEIDAYAGLFRDIADACAAQEVPASTAIAEYAPAQYEVNLKHVADPLAAADHAVLLKRIVRGVARKHGLDATFMAKPYANQPGNGMHLHMSLLDGEERNVFADGGEGINERLRHVLGGLVATAAEAMAVFAPNVNAYRRFRVGSYAPMSPTWGLENRTVALRVPGGAAHARRVEHRIAGADANVYLTVAAILAGAHHGLANRLDPGPQTTGNAYEKASPSLPTRWTEALDRFEAGTVIPDYLGREYCRLYAIVKRFEMSRFQSIVTPRELEWYLHAV